MPGRRSAKRVPTSFGRLLLARIEKAGLSVRAFAARVQVTHGYVSQVAYGRRPMAVDVVDPWVAALALSGPEADTFRDEAIIASCNEQAQRLFRRQQARIQSLEKQTANSR